jgi:hypothetical protein
MAKKPIKNQEIRKSLKAKTGNLYNYNVDARKRSLHYTLILWILTLKILNY